MMDLGSYFSGSTNMSPSSQMPWQSPNSPWLTGNWTPTFPSTGSAPSIGSSPAPTSPVSPSLTNPVMATAPQNPPPSPINLSGLPPMQSPGVQSGLFSNLASPMAPPGTVGPGNSAFSTPPPTVSPDILNQMIASGGNPISVLPGWQAMVDAQQRQIQENASQLAEQFNVGGNRTSTGFGTAMTDFFNQATLNQNAMLGQMTQTAQESAQQRLLQALGQVSGQQYGSTMDQYNIAAQMAQMLTGQQNQAAMQLPGMYSQFGQQQYTDLQNAIQNQYQEWLRQQPAYNPLLPTWTSLATDYPQMVQPGYQPGLLGGLLQGAGSVMGGVAGLIGKSFI